MSDYIAHHGVKGMKWGVRKEYEPHPRKSKSAAGKEYVDQLKSAQRQARAEQYAKQNNVSVDKAKAELDKQRKMLKALAIGGAVVAIGAGSYLAYTKLKKDPYGDDFTLAAGQSIFRTSESDSDSLHDTFYATPDSSDAQVYRNKWGKVTDNSGKATGENKYSKEYSANTDLKIAGKKTCETEFNNLMKNDKNFRTQVYNYKLQTGIDLTTYAEFDRYAPQLSAAGSSNMFNSYKNHMQSKGYAGIIDYNDKYGAGLGTKAPTIFFGGNSNFSTVDIHKLSDAEISAGKKEATKTTANRLMKELAPEMIKQGSIALGLGGIGVVAMDSAAKQAYEVQEKEKQKQ